MLESTNCTVFCEEKREKRIIDPMKKLNYKCVYFLPFSIINIYLKSKNYFAASAPRISNVTMFR